GRCVARARREDGRGVARLTDAVVARLTPGSTHWDAALPGFGIDVTARGVRTWIVEYCARGRTKRRTLGRHPSVSTEAARERARMLLSAAVLGHRVVRSATFGEVACQYLERHAKLRKRSWREDQRILEAYVLPRWRMRRAADVTPRDVRDLLDAIV